MSDTTAAEPLERVNRAPLYTLIASTGISGIGNAITGIAVPWFVLETTGSAARTGVAAFAGMLPAVIGGLLGGTIVDRLGHKRASVLADVASGVTVAVIPLLYLTVGLAFWQLLILVFLSALLDVPGNTARTALAPMLARLAAMPLERVNAASQTIGALSLLVGPPLAGVLIALVGPSRVLWIDAATFAVSAAAVAAAVPALDRTGGAEPGERAGYLTELGEGLRFIRDDRLLRAILAPSVVVNFLAAPLFAVVMPVFAERTYGEAVDLGLMLAGFGAGSLLGAVGYGVVGPRLPKRVTLIVAFMLSGLPFWALALQPALPIAVTLLALSGLAIAPINPLVMTVIQQRSPEALLGRVIGTVIAVATVIAPLGMLTAGIALQQIGVGWTLATVAAGFLLVGLSLLRAPALRELDRDPGDELGRTNTG